MRRRDKIRKGLDHNSGIVTRRVSEEMLQVDTRSSLTLRVTMLSLLTTAGILIEAPGKMPCLVNDAFSTSRYDRGAISDYATVIPRPILQAELRRGTEKGRSQQLFAARGQQTGPAPCLPRYLVGQYG